MTSYDNELTYMLELEAAQEALSKSYPNLRVYIQFNEEVQMDELLWHNKLDSSYDRGNFGVRMDNQTGHAIPTTGLTDQHDWNIIRASIKRHYEDLKLYS